MADCGTKMSVSMCLEIQFWRQVWGLMGLKAEADRSLSLKPAGVHSKLKSQVSIPNLQNKKKRKTVLASNSTFPIFCLCDQIKFFSLSVLCFPLLLNGYINGKKQITAFPPLDFCGE